jgi:hypothetical protein
VWADIRHNPDGTMSWGVECDNPALTIDGHFLTVIPGDATEQTRKQAEHLVESLKTFSIGKR